MVKVISQPHSSAAVCFLKLNIIRKPQDKTTGEPSLKSDRVGQNYTDNFRDSPVTDKEECPGKKITYYFV